MSSDTSQYMSSMIKQVLLLDEITVDLDVLARSNLLNFLKKECDNRGALIIYATHIFDGLDDWPSHIVRNSRCYYIFHGHHWIMFINCDNLNRCMSFLRIHDNNFMTLL